MNLIVEANTYVSGRVRPNIEGYDYLNFEVHGLKMEEIPVRTDIPPDLLSFLQFRLDNTTPVLNRIWPQDPCLVWMGALDKDGYAKHKPPKNYSGSTILSRYMWQHAIGDPKEVTIDHACGNKACINLWHLRLLPRDLNLAYGDPRKLNTEEGS